MPAKKVVKTSPTEIIQEMKAKGMEHLIPGTDRMIRLRTIDPSELLRDNKMPDILTPMVIKSVYQELPDKDVRVFMDGSKGSKEDALAQLSAIEYICEKGIVDGTKVKDLTIGEKRWIFRLVLIPAELLITFRYDPNADVEPVDEVKDLPQATE